MDKSRLLLTAFTSTTTAGKSSNSLGGSITSTVFVRTPPKDIRKVMTWPRPNSTTPDVNQAGVKGVCPLLLLSIWRHYRLDHRSSSVTDSTVDWLYLW